MKDSVRDQFNILRRQYAASLHEKVAQIENEWTKILQHHWDEKAIKDLHLRVHEIAGSAAVFGFSSLSLAARNAETHLQPLFLKGPPLAPDQEGEISQFLLVLREALTQVKERVPESADEKYIPPEAAAARAEEQKLIYLLEDNTALSQHIALQLGHFGYKVVTFTQMERITEATGKTPSDAIVIDLGPHEEAPSGIQNLGKAAKMRGAQIPLIFFSSRSDFETRLQAVRTGGSAFFTKPLDVGKLVDSLNILTENQTPEPYRILIVENDEIPASYYALVLKQAGITASIVKDPAQVMEILVDFKPDVIVTDLYVPECTGLEIASIIRQQEAHIGIPIVFLSTEINLDMQREAMRIGVDDFMTKPIEPTQLILSLTARAQRSRLLRSLMMRDALTGLLNHTSIKEHLAVEIARAKRNGTTLVFAMLDIDHFKEVNDTYGHHIGDRVIKSLSALLQQRLRKTDVVGRYGGDEIAVILPATNEANAAKIFDEMRTRLQSIAHQFEGGEFFITFSGGVALFPDYPDPDALIGAADRALYQAKREGRNRVAQAPAPVKK